MGMHDASFSSYVHQLLFILHDNLCSQHPHAGLTLIENAQKTIKTNYFGVLNVTNALLPLLQANSR